MKKALATIVSYLEVRNFAPGEIAGIEELLANAEPSAIEELTVSLQENPEETAEVLRLGVRKVRALVDSSSDLWFTILQQEEDLLRTVAA